MEDWLDNWYTDMYGVEACKKLFEELGEQRERWVVEAIGKKFRIRLYESSGTLRIELYDRVTGEMSSRHFPIGGFMPEQKEEIGNKALEAAEEGLPIMWKDIISPLIGGYWEDEEWDVITVHDIDRSKIDPNYRRFIK